MNKTLEAATFTVREVGEIEGRDFPGVVLEGSKEAVRAAGQLFGESVYLSAHSPAPAPAETEEDRALANFDKIKDSFFASHDVMLSAPAEGVRDLVQHALDLLQEKVYGNPARSPGHNAQLKLKAALALLPSAAEKAGVVGWRSMDSAPKDGTPFLVRYLPYGSAVLCMRRVRWVAADEAVQMQDMGAWLLVSGIDDDFGERLPTTGGVSWSVAADAHNDTRAWLWMPLPAAPASPSPATGEA